MKKIITFITCLFISFTCFAQLPDSVKHVEIVSEIQDTMILINKLDADVVNTLFYRNEILDSLNNVNENIIRAIKLENSKLEKIIAEQSIVINNKDEQLVNIQLKDKEVISDLEKQIKRANG